MVGVSVEVDVKVAVRVSVTVGDGDDVGVNVSVCVAVCVSAIKTDVAVAVNVDVEVEPGWNRASIKGIKVITIGMMMPPNIAIHCSGLSLLLLDRLLLVDTLRVAGIPLLGSPFVEFPSRFMFSPPRFD